MNLLCSNISRSSWSLGINWTVWMVLGHEPCWNPQWKDSRLRCVQTISKHLKIYISCDSKEFPIDPLHIESYATYIHLLSISRQYIHTMHIDFEFTSPLLFVSRNMSRAMSLHGVQHQQLHENPQKVQHCHPARCSSCVVRRFDEIWSGDLMGKSLYCKTEP